MELEPPCPTVVSVAAVSFDAEPVEQPPKMAAMVQSSSLVVLLNERVLVIRPRVRGSDLSGHALQAARRLWPRLRAT